ncbi:hypothetical protein SUGI_0674410 [Cryptomeria japonica]|nr:hypothetical protein SUGI_0674410 [Cryptomeria japonica]
MKGTSWKSSLDPTSGLFSIEMNMSLGKIKLVMVYKKSVPYWSTGEWIQNSFTKVLEVFTTWSQGSFQGQCSDYDICGVYGLCNVDGVFTCHEGFTHKKHDTQGWWSNGCARRRPLQCSVAEDTNDCLLEAKNQYLSEEGTLIYNKPIQQGCRIACLNNCSCTAFAFVISYPTICRLLFGNLFKMHVSFENQSIFIRLATSELGHLTSDGSSEPSPPLCSFLSGTIASVTVVFALLLVGFLL